MNSTLYDTLPLVLQWYYENATPNDTFFAAISGLGYMNTQVYGSRFRTQDQERIWREYVRLTEQYCRKLDMEGIALYNGSWSEPTPPRLETFRRFTRGINGLNYLLADLGRHENIHPGNACYLLDEVVVLHTLTRFEVWTASAEVLRQDKNSANAWLLKEIQANTPSNRPGFLSAMAISWYYYPSWLHDLKEKLPAHYEVVSLHDLARLFRENRQSQSALIPNSAVITRHESLLLVSKLVTAQAYLTPAIPASGEGATEFSPRLRGIKGGEWLPKREEESGREEHD